MEAAKWVLDTLKSKTVWAFIILFAINGVEGIKGQIPSEWLPVIDVILATIGIFGRRFPQQKF